MVEYPPPIRKTPSKDVSQMKMVNPPPSTNFTDVQRLFFRDKKACFGALIDTINDGSAATSVRFETINKLIELSQIVTDVRLYCDINALVKCLRLSVASKIAAIRVAALRCCAAFNKTRAFGAEMSRLGVGYFVARSLEREPPADAANTERMEVLRFISSYMELDVSLLPRAVLHALITCAEKITDNGKFACLCMQCLCEIAILNTELVWQCNGLKTIFDGVLKPMYKSLVSTFVQTITFIFDDEATRKYIRLGEALTTLFNPLLEFSAIEKSDGKDVAQGLGTMKKPMSVEEKNLKRYRIQTSLKLLVEMSDSWTGVLAMSANEMFRPVVNALRVPQPTLHKVLLDALFNMLHILIPETDKPFLGGSMSGSTKQHKVTSYNVTMKTPPPLKEPHNLLNNRIAVIIMGLVNAGIVDVLVELAKTPLDAMGATAIEQQTTMLIFSTGRKNASDLPVYTKAGILLGEIHFITGRLFPPSRGVALQLLPELIQSASEFENSEVRSRASTLVNNLHSYSRTQAENIQTHTLFLSRKGKATQAADNYRLKRIDEAKLKLEWSLSESALNQRIQDTNVLNTKDYTKWNWVLLCELLEGAMANVSNTEYVIAKFSNFFKRILMFYQPKENMFSKLMHDIDTPMFETVGLFVVDCLVNCPSGRKLFLEENFFNQAIAFLNDEMSAVRDSFSEKQMFTLATDKFLKSYSREYISFIGRLSFSEEGRIFLRDLNKDGKVSDLFYSLGSVMDKDEGVYFVVNSLNYLHYKEARDILTRFANSGSRTIRGTAVRYLRVLLRSSIDGFEDWAISLLVERTKDSDMSISNDAFSILTEACSVYPACLDATIGLIRDEDVMLAFEGGENFLLTYLSRPAGFALLKKSGYIKRNINSWAKEANIQYYRLAESEVVQLSKTRDFKYRMTVNTGEVPSVSYPPHFFGEMAKCEEGCQLLESREQVQIFIDKVKDPNVPAIEQRACMLALGLIGESETGFRLLEKSNALADIHEIAEHSPCLSLRGVAFVALGLLSANELGRTALEHYGWISAMSNGTETQQVWIAMPKNTQESPFFDIKSVRFQYPATTNHLSEDHFHDERDKILSNVVRLINPVVADTAAAALLTEYKASPKLFYSVELMYEIFKLLEDYSFDLNSRRFIYNLTIDSIPYGSKHLLEFMAYLDKMATPPPPDIEDAVKSDGDIFTKKPKSARKRIQSIGSLEELQRRAEAMSRKSRHGHSGLTPRKSHNVVVTPK